MSSDFRFDPLEIAGSGQRIIETAGENLANRQLVRYNAAGQVVLADASATATLPCIGITLFAANAGDKVEVLLKGYLGLSTWAWTPGDMLYVSDVAGAIIAVAGTFTQRVAVVNTATQIWFNPKGLDTGGTALIYARERPAALQGPRNVLNFIEGANITLTVADNVPNAEIDITIASTAEGAPTQEFFVYVSDPNANVGDHPGVDLPDATATTVYAQIYLPSDFTAITNCQIVVVSAASGDMVWTVDTDFGEICNSEDYNTHTDSGGATTALTINDLECLDMTGALTGALANDLVGVKFIRDGNNVNDTVGDSVYFLGIRVEYT